MGGAFIGLADDATAAFSNPAGLTILRSQEIGVEGRTGTTPPPSRTAVTTRAATGNGTDTVDGLVYGESSESVSGLSFLSYVYAGEGWALALYDHQLANFESSFTDRRDRSSARAPQPRPPVPGRRRMDLEIENYGASFAASPQRDLLRRRRRLLLRLLVRRRDRPLRLPRRPASARADYSPSQPVRRPSPPTAATATGATTSVSCGGRAPSSGSAGSTARDPASTSPTAASAVRATPTTAPRPATISPPAVRSTCRRSTASASPSSRATP